MNGRVLTGLIVFLVSGAALSAQITPELLKKAEGGDAVFQWVLGFRYANGDGVIKDAAEAVKWYRKAAEQGDADAQNNLGLMYDNGDGVIKDAAEAVKWYRKAAEQGNASAQFNLGLMYANGDGVIKDLVEAHAWFNVAGANGVDGAKNKLKIIEKNMTREQIAEATKLAKERFERINAQNIHL